ncbi:hypothetical protein CPB86DRAFT_746114 [Serendipita vermifera]|nr:hypothetical protein CPB86DRAFT_746114 [Serendipita vermifera]
MMVSKRWRYFILAESRLWTIISLKTCKYDINERVTWQLSLSGSLALTIYVSPSFNEWAVVRSGLIKHRERIETIALDYFYQAFGENQSPPLVREMLRDLSPLPNLFTLGPAIGPIQIWADIDEIVDLCGSLKRLPNVPLTGRTIRRMKGRLDLREVKTCDSISIISPILEKVLNVSEVECRPSGAFNRHEQSDSSTLKMNPKSNAPLPWKKLVYELFSHPFPVSFLRRLPMLTFLNIRTGFDTLKTILAMLHNLSNMKDLKLSSYIKDQDSLISPHKILPNSSIRVLHLDVYYISTPMAGAQWSGGANEILEMVFAGVPHAETIHLRTNLPQSFQFLTLDGFKQVRDLELDCNEGIGLIVSPVELPSQVVNVVLMCPPSTITFFRSTSVRSLYYRNMSTLYTNPEGKVDFHPPIATSNWPRLETAQLDTRVFDWKQSGLSSLRSINLSVEWNSKHVDHTLTSFLCELALRPGSYPILEKITLFECPEWDILVIMLERRNLLADSYIQPITSLTVPGKCPSHIYQLISDLVEGKWLPRPTNKELSLAGNVKAILDPTSPGCLKCHRMLRACNEPIIDNGEDPNLYEDDDTMLLRLQEYPDEDEEILSTWDTRVKLWDDLERLAKFREPTCHPGYIPMKTIDRNLSRNPDPIWDLKYSVRII